MDLIDTDGDRLEFRIGHDGSLREYVNGKLDITCIRSMRYSVKDGSVSDDTGVFHLREEPEKLEKALGLRALASRTGAEWLGDEPEAATKVELTDTDGDRLEFCLMEGGRLQERNNDEVELEDVRWLEFHLSTGLVRDPSGEFTIKPHECMQKAAALRSLAGLCGIEWRGDEPGLPAVTASARPLDIENCDADWELQCPKRWESLKETANPSERFCDTCKETVYFCTTEEQLLEHTLQRRCVAFDLCEPKASLAEEGFPIRFVLLSGQELPEIRALPSHKVSFVKRSLVSSSGIPMEELRLILGSQELSDDMSLEDAGVVPKAFIQVARVPKPEVKLDPGVRRKMGKRRRPLR